MRITRIAGITGAVGLLIAATLLRSSLDRGDETGPRGAASAHPSGDPALGRGQRFHGGTTGSIASISREAPRPALRHEDPAPSPPSDPSPAETSVDELRAAIDHRFQSDGHDPAWAAVGKRQAEKLLTNLPAGSSLRSLECKASICRAEVNQADLSAHQTFLQGAITSGSGWEGPAMAALEPRSDDGPVVTVVYLGRTAGSLIDPAPAEALDMPSSPDP